MEHLSVFMAALMVLTNVTDMGMTEITQSDQFAIGILTNNNFGGKESIETLFRMQLHGDVNFRVDISHNLSSKPGGLLENIKYFKSTKAKVILDLQRENDEADTLAQYLNVPVITMAPQSKPHGPFTISMYPDISVINTAILDFLARYQIDEALMLYDEQRSLQAMNLHTQGQKRYVKMEVMPGLKMHDIKMIKRVIRMAWKIPIKTVILLCDTQDIKTVVKATLQARLYDKDRQLWKWIASDMDFRTPDYKPLEGFVGFSLPAPNAKFINFQGTRLKSAFKENVFSDVFYASVIDALRLINQLALRFNKMDKLLTNSTAVLKALTNVTLPTCTRKKDTNCGLTGEIKFDANGLRKIEDLDFVVISEKKLIREWKWNSDPPKSRFPKADQIRWVADVVENYLCHEKRDEKPMKKLKRNFTIMFQKSDPPFVIVDTNKSNPSQDDFKGFSVDIVKKLAKKMEFEYKFVVLEKGGSGSKKDGKWNGLVGALINKKADIAIGSFTITAEREEVIDFSKPFMDFRMALILRIPEEKESLFNFHKPFSGDIWLMVVLTVFVMTFLLYCVDYLSPIGYRKTAENLAEGEEFNLFNSLWFATASMLQQGGDNTPKAPSGRILAAAFWFFILIIISTYTANLAAFFTNKKIESPINNLEDLVSSPDIKYGVLEGGQVNSFLEKSKAIIHRKMNSHIKEKQTNVNSSKTGVQKARMGGYAYLSEMPILDYYNKRKPCDTMLVKNLLEVKSYGFGLPKNSKHTNRLSVGILELREEGFIEKRRKFWWDEKSQCNEHKPQSGATVTLKLHSLGGVFIVMIGGSVISFILVAIEIKFKWIIDLIMKAQENNAGNEEQRSEAVMRVEISQGDRTLNPINRTESSRKRWFSPLGLGR